MSPSATLRALLRLALPGLPLLGLVLTTSGCQNEPGVSPEAAASAVKSWVPEGVKGNVVVSSVRCQPAGASAFRCAANVRGGGTLEVDAKHAEGWTVALSTPILSAELLENQIRDHLAKMDVAAVASCGDRVRPAEVGDTFKCLIRDPEGKEVSAAEVTVKDAAKGNVDWKLLTSLVDVAKVEERATAWLAEHDVTGKVDCGAPRTRFSLPDTVIACAVEGHDRKVATKMTDYRGRLTFEWME